MPLLKIKEALFFTMRFPTFRESIFSSFSVFTRKVGKN
jgi:hypothetical protein